MIHSLIFMSNLNFSTNGMAALLPMVALFVNEPLLAGVTQLHERCNLECKI